GQTGIYGSRNATRKGFASQLISDGEGWMDMLQSRNQTSHTYNEETAEEISSAVINRYYQLFIQLKEKMNGLLDEEKQNTQ
ncbi:MAG: nucleotidyltransferase substrate binding protein, partial [Thermodesulfobacteriota bacterium]